MYSGVPGYLPVYFGDTRVLPEHVLWGYRVPTRVSTLRVPDTYLSMYSGAPGYLPVYSGYTRVPTLMCTLGVPGTYLSKYSAGTGYIPEYVL